MSGPRPIPTAASAAQIADRLAALGAGEEVGDDRQGCGHDQSCADSHRRPHEDHLVGRVGHEGAEARQPEDRHAGLERELAS